MPEGDTIFRTARTLQRALAGQSVTRFETVLPKLARIDYDTPLAGRTVDSVESRGKWLLIQPTTAWALMKTPLKKDAFEVATDLYYVNVTKQ